MILPSQASAAIGAIMVTWFGQGVAAFLLSDDAAFVTGESIVANGGGDGARL